MEAVRNGSNIGFPDGLDLRCNIKRGIKHDSEVFIYLLFLSLITTKIHLSSAETDKVIGGAGLGKRRRNQLLFSFSLGQFIMSRGYPNKDVWFE